MMDSADLEHLLQGIETGAVRVITRDLAAPSPLAEEILTARPYASPSSTTPRPKNAAPWPSLPAA